MLHTNEATYTIYSRSIPPWRDIRINEFLTKWGARTSFYRKGGALAETLGEIEPIVIWQRLPLSMLFIISHLLVYQLCDLTSRVSPPIPPQFWRIKLQPFLNTLISLALSAELDFLFHGSLLFRSHIFPVQGITPSESRAAAPNQKHSSKVLRFLGAAEASGQFHYGTSKFWSIVGWLGWKVGASAKAQFGFCGS